MSPAAPARQRMFTTAEQIDFQIDRLMRIKQSYANERRPHHVTEHLVDELDDVGRALRKIGRGACPRS